MCPIPTSSKHYDVFPLAAQILVDFSQRSDPPLFKKFKGMNAGLVDLPRYQRDLQTMRVRRKQTLDPRPVVAHA